ncbi:hypothetical protein KTE26_21980 [Ralstonia mannitolilytica]|uniref:hypothetical protein n=1 Tax=Ralstonia mannitolilytica TaxID=105219 RepID=UPI000CEEBECD|nr:hypothetical protein [Ralstonia mannitolilytica]MBU9581107.1 hypothetical protein [Ralstonia mannitolilytica]
MSPFEANLHQHTVGTTFFVNPTMLNMSHETFHAFAETLVAGQDPRVRVVGAPHRESYSGARRIELVKLERVS